MAFITPNGQLVGDPSLGEPLAKAKNLVDQVRSGDLFNINKDAVNYNPTIFDPYETDHKSSIQVSIFLGSIFIKEIAGIETVEESTKTPAYHYASRYFSRLIEGKYSGKGNLYIYETRTGEFQATIAKYKKLLEEEKLTSLRIRDIAAQRLNLLRASIESQLLTRFSAENAARFSKEAIDTIETEIITSEQWDIPRLTIISGAVTDPNPLIDVFELVSFNRASKALISDGSTQLMVYSFIAKRRLLREKPIKPTKADKWRLNLPETINSYTSGFVDSFVKGLSLRIRAHPGMAVMNPNNIMYAGTLPNSFTGWGPKLCYTNYVIEQKIPRNVRFDAQLFKERDRENARTGKLETVTDTGMGAKRRVTIRRASRFGSPDPFYLMAGIKALSKSIPTSENLAFSWLIPGPRVESDFKMTDQLTSAISGTTLTSAFFSVRMTTGEHADRAGFVQGENFVKAHTPVRSMAFLPTPKLEGDNLVSYQPISQVFMGRGLDTNASISNWKKILRMEDVSRRSVAVPKQYNYDRWFLFGFFLVFEPGGIIGDIIEAMTLGGFNTDGVEYYEHDLEDFPAKEVADTLGVQIFPMIVDNASDLRDNVTGEQVDNGFRIDADLTENPSLVNQLLRDGTCIEEGVKWIWSVTDTDSATPKFNIAAQWTRDGLSKLNASGDYVLLLCRIVSHPLTLSSFISGNAAPGSAGSGDITPGKDLEEFVRKTEFIAPTSVALHDTCSIDLMIRTDRSYIDTPRSKVFEFLGKIPEFVSKGLTWPVAKGAQWAGSISSTKTGQSWFDAIYASEGGVLKQIYNTTVNSADSVYTPTVRAITNNDVMDFIGNSIDNIVGVNPISLVNGLFRDSTIDDTLGVDMTSVYVDRYRYIVNLNTLTEAITSQISKDILEISGELDDPRLFNIGDPEKGVNSGALKDQVFASLETQFNIEGSIAGFDVARMRKSDIDPTELSGQGQIQDVGAGTIGDEAILSLTKSGIPPSPFVMDDIYNNVSEQYKALASEEDGTPVPRGIVAPT